MATSPRTSEPVFFRPARPLRRSQIDDLLRLQKAAQKISSILDLDELIDRVVNEVVVSFGCVEANIYLHEPDAGEMVLAGVHGCTVSRKGYRLKIGKEGMVGYVASTRQMRYAPDVSKDPYYMACEPETRSEVAIPLEVDDKLVGVCTASHSELDAFSPEQLRLFQSLCSHIAAAVLNAQRFQEEKRARERMVREADEARLIQQALFPKSSPYVPGFSIAGASCPAGAVGGDWYDFLPLDQGRYGIVLADVAGKGTAAALLMSATRGMLRSLAEACCTPAEVLTKLNRLMIEDFPTGRFVTMIYGVLNPASRTFTFANAGHLPPLLVQDSGSHLLTSDSGLPLGVSFGSFSETSVHLPEQARLLLYSDGITEATNVQDEEYGIARLKHHFVDASPSPEAILDAVHRFSSPAPLRDDATVIVVKASD